jgi:tetraacyldisaccharide 4'-kinase
VQKLRLILLPLGWVYALVVEGIKMTYRLGWQKRKRFEVATVVVGNLSTGGTGKTPHVEYILKHLSPFHEMTVLSRGYGRTSKGIHWVSVEDSALEAGDEPLQIARKFEQVAVVLAEKRVAAVPEILSRLPQTQLLVLDDAMQHWPVLADSYIMISTYQKPFFQDFPLPAGNLREFRFNYKRADIILISKCPKEIKEDDRKHYLKRIKPLAHQKVFFSYFKYGELYQFQQSQERISWDQIEGYAVFLLTGLANPKPLEDRLRTKAAALKTIRYRDHHNYTNSDWAQIKKAYLKFREQQSADCIFVTTEKDVVRLAPLLDPDFSIFIAPVEVEIAFGEAAAFQRAIVEVMYKKKGYPAS